MSERISDERLAAGKEFCNAAVELRQAAGWARSFDLNDQATLAAELQEWRRGPSAEQTEAAARAQHERVRKHGPPTGEFAWPPWDELPEHKRAWRLLQAEDALRAAWHLEIVESEVDPEKETHEP